MIAQETIDVRTLLHELPEFDPQAVEQLQTAFVRGQANEIRQQLGELESRIRQGDDAPRNLLAAGITAWMLGRHNVADHYLGQLPGNGLAEYYRGHVLLAMERPEDAAGLFEQAGRDGHDPVQCTLCRAGAIRLAGRVDEAEALLRSTGREGATRAEYSYQLGCIRADRGDTFGAVEYFERAVDMDPAHSGALFRLAGMNNLLGNDTEAIGLYERSLARPPLFLGALINLGLLYEDAEKYSAAAYCFRRVLSVYPNHPRALLYLKDIEAASDMYYDEDTFRRQRELDLVLQTPIADFELTSRARNCLERAGIFTLGDLVRTSEEELLAGKNCGETTLREILDLVESRGLQLGQAVKPKPAVSYPAEDLAPQERAKLDMSVNELNLTVRARKCLSRLGINTIGQLVSKSPDELLSVRNFGVTSLNEIRAKLTEFDLRLHND